MTRHRAKQNLTTPRRGSVRGSAATCSAFRKGHPCWRKVTDPLLLSEPGAELVLLDPDVYFPNRFRFRRPRRPRGVAADVAEAQLPASPRGRSRAPWTAGLRARPPRRYRRLALARGQPILNGSTGCFRSSLANGRRAAAHDARRSHRLGRHRHARGRRLSRPPPLWVCWHRTQAKRLRLKLGTPAKAYSRRASPGPRMKCFHAGGEAKWWVARCCRWPKHRQRRRGKRVCRPHRQNPAPSSSSPLTRYGCEQRLKGAAARPGLLPGVQAPNTRERPARPSVLIVAENASVRFGGEAILPYHYFRLLLARGIDAHLIVHERCPRGAARALPAAVRDRLHFVADQLRYKSFSSLLGRMLLPTGVSTRPPFGLANQMLTQHAPSVPSSAAARSSPDTVVHQPIPVSPRFPSLLYGLGAPLVVGPLNGGMEYPRSLSARKAISSAGLPSQFGRSFLGLSATPSSPASARRPSSSSPTSAPGRRSPASSADASSSCLQKTASTALPLGRPPGRPPARRPPGRPPAGRPSAKRSALRLHRPPWSIGKPSTSCSKPSPRFPQPRSKSSATALCARPGRPSPQA